MYTDSITLPPESMIAGTTKKLVLYLYTRNMKKQIDANGMIARFVLTDYVNPSDAPLISKSCTVSVPDGEKLAVINVQLNREDTLSLAGKYIYQVTINDEDTIEALKGIMDIGCSIDVAEI